MTDNTTPNQTTREEISGKAWRAKPDPCPVNGGIFDSGDHILIPPTGKGPAAIVSGDHVEAILAALQSPTDTADRLRQYREALESAREAIENQDECEAIAIIRTALKETTDVD